MAADVVFHAASGDAAEVEIGVDYALAVPERLGELVAVGVDDAAPAAAHHVRQRSYLRRRALRRGVHLPREVHVAVHKIAVALYGDVPYRVLPLRVVVRVGRDVDGHAPLIERDAREGHVAFPADEAAHRAPGRAQHGEEVAVCVAPDHALAARGLELAVVERRAVGRDEHVGVIERRRHGVALGIAYAEVYSGLLRRLAQGAHLLPVREDRILVVAQPVAPPRLSAAAHGVAEGHAVWVARDEELREYHKVRAALGALVDEPERLFRTFRRRKHNRRRLHHRKAAAFPQILHILTPKNVLRHYTTRAPTPASAQKPRPLGRGFVMRFIPTRSCQKFSKQICLWDLTQGIGIISIIQIVEAI